MSLNYNDKPLFERKKFYAVNGRLLKTPLTFEIIDENYLHTYKLMCTYEIFFTIIIVSL